MADIIEFNEFWNAIFRNGQLHVFDAETGKLLGRKDAYLPVNMMWDGNRARARTHKLQTIQQSRLEIEQRGYWSLSDLRRYAWDPPYSKPMLVAASFQAGFD